MNEIKLKEQFINEYNFRDLNLYDIADYWLKVIAERDEKLVEWAKNNKHNAHVYLGKDNAEVVILSDLIKSNE